MYKPAGMTSHDVVDVVRKKTGEQRVGHAGTLDPAARGVLVIGVGRESTRTLHAETAKEKEYVARIFFGAVSTTDDAEGVITTHAVTEQPDTEAVRKVIQQYIGHIQQLPPVYSALKVRGVPAHRRVRRGEQVTLAPRTVCIKNIILIEYAWPWVTLRVTCGPGVYIRALARDMGAALGTGAYLADLERTRVGAYTADAAVRLEQLDKNN